MTCVADACARVGCFRRDVTALTLTGWAPTATTSARVNAMKAAANPSALVRGPASERAAGEATAPGLHHVEEQHVAILLQGATAFGYLAPHSVALTGDAL